MGNICTDSSLQAGLRSINRTKYNEMMARCREAESTRSMIAEKKNVDAQLEEREFKETLAEASKTPFENPKFQFAAIGIIVLIIGLIVWKRS